MTDWIFTHGDGDGICSGALALAANPGFKVFFTHPFGLFEDLKQVKRGERVIICDIALSEAHLDQLLRRFKEINEASSLVYVDHHPLPLDLRENEIPCHVVHSDFASASELVFTLFEDKLDVSFSRIAIYGAVSDYLDNTPKIIELLRLWDKRTIYFETGVLVQGIEGMRRKYDFKREIVKQLSKNIPPSFNKILFNLALINTRFEEELIKIIKREVKSLGEVAYVVDISPLLGKSAIYAMSVTGNLVGIAGETRGEVVDVSLRTRSDKINLNKILRKIAVKMGGSGGGHPKAAGARIPKVSFKEFLKRLNEEISRFKDDVRTK